MVKLDRILGFALFWIVAAAIVLSGVVGVRRAGAVLTAHQAGLVGGRAQLGPGQAEVEAASGLFVWWGIGQGDVQDVVEVTVYPERRSFRVVIEGAMRTLFGGTADLGAGSFQRDEGFWPGPPDEWE